MVEPLCTLMEMLQRQQKESKKDRREEQERQDKLRREDQQAFQQTLVQMFKTQSEEREAARRAVEEERRLEREECRREQEECLEREEACRAEDRERERRREQRLKAERALELKRRDTPKLKRMTEDADVDEYMYDFERYVGSLEIPEEEWVIYLLPLLSESANRAVKTLDLHEQQI